MYGRIFGFQRLARCPKWTPASIRSLTWTMATHGPPTPWWEKRIQIRNKNAPFAAYSSFPLLEGEEVHRNIPSANGQRVLRTKRGSAGLESRLQAGFGQNRLKAGLQPQKGGLGGPSLAFLLRFLLRFLLLGPGIPQRNRAVENKCL